MIAITKVDVGMTAAKEHGAIARSWSSKVVRGGIVLRVSFGFHYAAGEANAGEFADDNFANEKTGEGDGVRGQFGTAEATDGNGSFAGRNGWQARQSSQVLGKSNLTPDQVVPTRLA
jgi:hypothetical protein